MSKWKHVSEERKKQIFAFNSQRAQDAETAADLKRLLSALPPGQVKNLMKNEVCAAILEKYGIMGKEE